MVSFVSGTNLQSLKQELELDVHRIGLDELCQRFNSDLDRGLTKSAALEGNRKYGLNALTPPPTTPGMTPDLFEPIYGRQVFFLTVFFHADTFPTIVKNRNFSDQQN